MEPQSVTWHKAATQSDMVLPELAQEITARQHYWIRYIKLNFCMWQIFPFS